MGILKGRFKLGEPAMVDFENTSFSPPPPKKILEYYYKHFNGERWSGLEKMLIKRKSIHDLKIYFEKVLKSQRNKDFESLLLKYASSELLFEYMTVFIKQKWDEAGERMRWFAEDPSEMFYSSKEYYKEYLAYVEEGRLK